MARRPAGRFSIWDWVAVEFSYPTVLIIPVALGLLGFVEPCTLGGHLVFLRTVMERSPLARTVATLTFTLIRTLVMGSFGAMVALLGGQLVRMQTAFWLVFGSLYLLVGLAYLAGRKGILKRNLGVSPATWRVAANPVVLGAAFGLNIRACAAPILFGLIGLAAGSGAISLGFVTMAVFGLALSVPLVVFSVSPAMTSLATRFASGRPAARWIFAFVFLALGAWSIWFGLFVDPADWAAIW